MISSFPEELNFEAADDKLSKPKRPPVTALPTPFLPPPGKSFGRAAMLARAIRSVLSLHLKGDGRSSFDGFLSRPTERSSHSLGVAPIPTPALGFDRRDSGEWNNS